MTKRLTGKYNLQPSLFSFLSSFLSIHRGFTGVFSGGNSLVHGPSGHGWSVHRRRTGLQGGVNPKDVLGFSDLEVRTTRSSPFSDRWTLSTLLVCIPRRVPVLTVVSPPLSGWTQGYVRSYSQLWESSFQVERFRWRRGCCDLSLS